MESLPVGGSKGEPEQDVKGKPAQEREGRLIFFTKNLRIERKKTKSLQEGTPGSFFQCKTWEVRTSM